MKHLLFFIGLFFFPIAGYSAPPAELLAIELSQQTDSACSNNYSTTEPAIPGSCIQYQIHLSNHSAEILRDLKITGKIPEYTQLHQVPSLISEHQTRQTMPYTIEKDIEQAGATLHIRLEELLPTREQATIIEYQVKIDE